VRDIVLARGDQQMRGVADQLLEHCGDLVIPDVVQHDQAALLRQFLLQAHLGGAFFAQRLGRHLQGAAERSQRAQGRAILAERDPDHAVIEFAADCAQAAERVGERAFANAANADQSVQRRLADDGVDALIALEQALIDGLEFRALKVAFGQVRQAEDISVRLGRAVQALEELIEARRVIGYAGCKAEVERFRVRLSGGGVPYINDGLAFKAGFGGQRGVIYQQEAISKAETRHEFAIFLAQVVFQALHEVGLRLRDEEQFQGHGACLAKSIKGS
jgi:hypothetical protein